MTHHTPRLAPGQANGSVPYDQSPPALVMPELLQREYVRPAHYTVAILDGHGRVATTTPLRALGWKPGDLITFSINSNRLIIATRTDDSVQPRGTAPARKVTPRGHLNLPVITRRRAGLAEDDHLLLAAGPRHRQPLDRPAERPCQHPAALHQRPGPAMTTPAPDPTAANVALVAALMAQLGITADHIIQSAPPTARRPVPTFDDYIPQVSNGVSPGSRRAYDTYWRRIREKWGSRRLDEPTPLEIKQFAEEIRETAVIRRNHRGGAAAAEHLIAALRCIYRYAIADRLLNPGDNPATRVDKPHRQPSLRYALPDPALAAIVATAGETGNDPELDLLILRLHIETACRRGGALALRPQDLDVDQCLILLREKGRTQRWQPISPTLMKALTAHYTERGNGTPAEQLLRYRDGRLVGRRRYDYLWQRIGEHVPWVAVQQISAHWLRHTTLTWVERHFSYAVARAYAGHAGGTSETGTTVTYVKATLQEVAQALAALTGEPHPLAAADPMTTMMISRR